MRYLILIPLIIIFILIFTGAVTYFSFWFFKAFPFLRTNFRIWILPSAIIGFILFSFVLQRFSVPIVTPVLQFITYIFFGWFFYFLIFISTFHLFYHFNKSIPPSLLFISASFISALISGYGIYEADNLRSHLLTIKTQKINFPSNKSVRLVFITDLHFSSINQTHFAKKIVNLIKHTQPDIIISGGDLIDPGITHRSKIINYLKKLRAPDGKFAVTGNHEAITDLDYAINFHNDAGFKLIRNNFIYLKKYNITIVGIDDPMIKQSASQNSESNILQSIKTHPETTNSYVILVKHRPDVSRKSINLFDLQLSGHTHGGQMFPLNIIVGMVFKYLSGYFKLSNKSSLYVSKGAGTWGPPMRIFAKPEITIIDFTPNH